MLDEGLRSGIKIDLAEQPVNTIIVGPGTVVNEIAPEEKRVSYADVSIGDEVTVYPSEDRADLTREALTIDLIKY